MEISAQVSLYPLGQSNLAAPIEAVWNAFRNHGLSFQPGAMSTLLQGDEQGIFAALQDAFAQATHYGGAVMVITLSNVCPARVPREHSADDA